jgi:hypothetical protein
MAVDSLEYVFDLVRGKVVFRFREISRVLGTIDGADDSFVIEVDHDLPDERIILSHGAALQVVDIGPAVRFEAIAGDGITEEIADLTLSHADLDLGQAVWVHEVPLLDMQAVDASGQGEDG